MSTQASAQNTIAPPQEVPVLLRVDGDKQQAVPLVTFPFTIGRRGEGVSAKLGADVAAAGDANFSGELHFLQRLGMDAIAFGDLYLQDIRRYRETQFGNCGMELLFPLWDVPTRELANQMLGSGLRARLSCVDPRAVPAEWAGRDYDSQLLAELPASVDPCAENGEFHTFVYASPMFRKSIRVVNGETVERDGFIFADLLEVSAAANPTTSAGPAILAG